MAGQSACGKGDEDEVDAVEGEGEVGDEFTAGDEGDHGDRPEERVRCLWNFHLGAAYVRDMSFVRTNDVEESEEGQSKRNVHEQATIQQPHQAQQPTLRRITSQVVPSENHLEAERRAGDEGGEEKQKAGGEVIEGL